MKQYRIIISGGGTEGISSRLSPLPIPSGNVFRRRKYCLWELMTGWKWRKCLPPVIASWGCRLAASTVPTWPITSVSQVVCSKASSLPKDDTGVQTRYCRGVGGYASGPTLWMAASLGIPTLIQEQNSYAGVTNKLLAKKAGKICVAYEGMEKFFPADRIVVTGNPVRQDLEEASDKREEALKFFGLSRIRRRFWWLAAVWVHGRSTAAYKEIWINFSLRMSTYR